MDDMQQAEREIEELSEQLRRHEYLYYVKAAPQISDLEYDRMMNRLIELEQRFPSLKKPDSPSQRVGSDLAADFPEVQHTIPVLSLDKAYTSGEVLQWMQRCRNRGEDNLSFVVEEKIDGVSIVLYYEEGILARAVTRGNGFVGNDVTANVRTIASVPLRLSKPHTLVARGEVYLTREEFYRLNTQMEIPYANPRNLAAGSIRRLKSSETARIPLKMFVYEGYWNEGGPRFTNHLQILDTFLELGLPVNPRIGLFAFLAKQASDEAKKVSLPHIVTGSYSDLPDYLKKTAEQRKSIGYDIDGLVIKINELDVRQLLGYTDRHPRWAIAFKFEAPEAQTKVISIDVQVGRTGRITPVARVERVQVGGSMVSNVTLHNQDYINMLELAIGDTVSVSKRGDVIPAIERVIEKNTQGNTTWRIPSHCPSCHTLLVEKGAHSYCPNPGCPEQVFQRIVFFAGREQMDIEGFGPETVAFLMKKGLLFDIPDIYRIDYLGLIGEPGFGEKKAKALAQAVEKSKEQPFSRVLVSLGIPEVGKNTVDLLLSAGFNSIDKLFALVDENNRAPLLAIKGFGEKTVSSLFAYLADPAMRSRIEALRAAGLHFEELREEKKDQFPQIFNGQTWCVTGSFEHFVPRGTALARIEERGGRTTSSVTSKTTHLLAGKNAGSKLQQAKRLGVSIVSEEQFLCMLREAGYNG